MGMWKNLFNKTIHYIDKAFSQLDQEDKIGWGVHGGIDAMMESRQKVKQKEQWMTQHLQKRALFQQLRDKKN